MRHNHPATKLRKEPDPPPVAIENCAASHQLCELLPNEARSKRRSVNRSGLARRLLAGTTGTADDLLLLMALVVMAQAGTLVYAFLIR
jgi:hypothetical protein